MKKLSLFLAFLTLVCLFGGCNKTDENAIIGENNNIAIVNSSNVDIDTVVLNFPNGSIVDKSQDKKSHILPKGETKYFPVAEGENIKFSINVTDSKGRETKSKEFTANFSQEGSIVNVKIEKGEKKGKLKISCDTSVAQPETNENTTDKEQ